MTKRELLMAIGEAEIEYEEASSVLSALQNQLAAEDYEAEDEDEDE